MGITLTGGCGANALHITRTKFCNQPSLCPDCTPIEKLDIHGLHTYNIIDVKLGDKTVCMSQLEAFREGEDVVEIPGTSIQEARTGMGKRCTDKREDTKEYWDSREDAVERLRDIMLIGAGSDDEE